MIFDLACLLVWFDLVTTLGGGERAVALQRAPGEIHVQTGEPDAARNVPYERCLDVGESATGKLAFLGFRDLRRVII
jgi:hypothetical protein